MKGAAIMAALPAVLDELLEQAAFRIYLTDSLFYYGDNKRLTERYIELINPDRKRGALTSQEADAMAKRLGITFTTE